MIDNNINYDKYILDKRENVKYYMTAGAALLFIGYVFYSNVYISAALVFLSIPLKKLYVKLKIKIRRDVLRQQFRDLLYSLSASVSAGRQMWEAIIESRGNLSLMYSKQEPIMAELEQMGKSIEESRLTDEQLLKDFAYRSGIEEIINFAEVYATCRTTGADVAAMISKASEILMDKMTIDREISTITAQKKAESKIISAMPIIIIIFLNVVSPGYLDNLYHTLLGRFIMTAALMTMGVSYYVMNKIVEVKV